MAKNMLFKSKEKNVTGRTGDLVAMSKKYLEPGYMHAKVTIEENIIGFKFYVVCNMSGYKIIADTVYNKKFNPNTKMNAEQFSEVLGRWPRISPDSFRFAPITDYTMQLVYYNRDIVSNKPVNYKQEGLHVVDIVPHGTGIPLSYKAKKEFVSHVLFGLSPLRYHGFLNEGYQQIPILTTTSAIAEHDQGAGIRIYFEPRQDNDIYIVLPTEQTRTETLVESTGTQVSELVNFLLEPERIISVFDKGGIHPSTDPEQFTKNFIGHLYKDMPDFINEYFQQTHVINPNYTKKQFMKDIEKDIKPKLAEMTSQMKRFTIKKEGR